MAAVLTTPPVSRTICPSITPSWPYADDASSASSPIATSCSSLSPVATKSSSSGAAVTDSAILFLLSTFFLRTPSRVPPFLKNYTVELRRDRPAAQPSCARSICFKA